MNAPSPVLVPTANHIERMSTRIAFLIAGLLMSAWASLVPLVKARAGLDDGGLGLFGCITFG